MSNRIKDRNISIAEFLMNLQKEYVISDFRRKVYVSPADRRYYQKVMDFKKEKIDNISERNNLPTIFTSDEVKKGIYSELFDSLNKPKFNMTEDDERFYFSYDSEFILHSKKRIGKLQKVIFDKNQAVLLLDEELIHVELTDISRVL